MRPILGIIFGYLHLDQTTSLTTVQDTLRFRKIYQTIFINYYSFPIFLGG